MESRFLCVRIGSSLTSGAGMRSRNLCARIGAGGIVSVQVGNQNPLTVLFEKTAGPSKGKLAQASGLSDGHPLKVLWREVVEETGILILREDARRLDLVVPQPSELDPAFANCAEQSDFFDNLMKAKEGQISVIRGQLPEDLKTWDITVVRRAVIATPEDDHLLNPVEISLPGMRPLKTRVIISDNEKMANLNLLRPVRLELTEGTKFICVDPEEFKRTMHLVTRAEMLTRDFIDTKASVPMKPYLERAMQMEVNAAPVVRSAPIPGL
jgi:hypothetical protein